MGWTERRPATGASCYLQSALLQLLLPLFLEEKQEICAHQWLYNVVCCSCSVRECQLYLYANICLSVGVT